MDFLTMFLISLAITIAGELLRPKPKFDTPKPSSLGDFQFPTAEEGRAIPVIYGTVKVAGPNVVWWGDLTSVPITKKVKTGIFSSTRITQGYKYFLGMQCAISWGAVDEFIGIEFDDKEVPLTGRTDTADLVSFTMNGPKLLSADDPPNGITGPVKIYMGTLTQVQNEYLAAQFGEANIPAYRGVCYAVFEKCYLGNNDTVPKVAFKFRRTPNPLGLTGNAHNINGDANPMNIIFEVMTNTQWGASIPSAMIDTTSFVACAQTLASEGLGISMQLDTSGSAQDIIAEVGRHINGVVYYEPTTGKWVAKLARDDYNIATLPLLDESNISADSYDYSRGSWDETRNTVKVSYIDREQNFTERMVQHQNLANITVRNGQVDAEELDFRGFSNADAANLAAARALKSLSSPLSKVEFEVNRTQYPNLRPGSVFKHSWEQLGIEQQVYRVTEVDYGTLDSPTLKIKAVEDIFSVAFASYIAPPPTGWVNPITTPGAMPLQRALEVPYGLTASADRYVMTLGAPGTGSPIGYSIYQDPAGGTAWVESDERANFTAVATTSAEYRASSTASLTVVEAFGLTGMEIPTQAEYDAGEQYALIVSSAGEEIIAWRTLTNNNNSTFTVGSILRGQMDTPPLSHPAGATVWFLHTGFGVTQDVPYTSNSTVNVRLTPYSARGELPVASATTLPVVLADRASRPYPPANLRLNSTYMPDTITGAVTAAWSSRNRLTQGRVPYSQTGADVTAEASTTYNVRWYDETGTLRRTHSGLSGLSQAWDTEQADCGLRQVGSNTVSLLHFDGANGSTTFTDDTGLTWTANGNAQISTAQSRFGGSSLLLDGTNDHITCTSDVLINIARSDFTFEAWVRLTTWSGNICVFCMGDSSSSYWQITLDSTQGLRLNIFGSDLLNQGNTTGIATGTWIHVAVSRQGNTLRGFIDGVQRATSTSGASIPSLTTNVFRIGENNIGSGDLNGHVDEVRLSNVARYTAGFTPPAAPFVDESDRSVISLLHLDGPNGGTSFGDDAGLTWATENGTITISTAQSRFGGASATFPTTNNSRLKHTPASSISVGTGDFTVEFWFRLNNTRVATGGLFDARPQAGSGPHPCVYLASDNSIRYFFSGADRIVTAASFVTAGVWRHVAVSRAAGTTRMFVDGTQVGSNYVDNSNVTLSFLTLGGLNVNSTIAGLNGQIDEFRFSRSARYTGNFTPPTAPFSLATGAEAAGVRDNLVHYYALDEASGTTFRDSEPQAGLDLTILGTGATVAQATIRSGGVRSVNFTSTSRANTAALPAEINTANRVSASAWIRLASFSSSANVIFLTTDGGETEVGNVQFYLAVNSAGRLVYLHEYGAGTNETITASGMTPLVLNTNYHVAVTRDSVAAGGTNTIRFYVNGTLVDTQTYTNARTGGTATASRLVVGNGEIDGSVNVTLNGRLQDLLLTSDLLTDAEVAWLWNGGIGRSVADVFGIIDRLNNRLTVEVESVRSGVTSRSPLRWTTSRDGSVGPEPPPETGGGTGGGGAGPWAATGSFPAATRGTSYTWQNGTGLSITGGVDPGEYVGMATTGLPAGLTLYYNLYPNGPSLRGKPTAAGTFPVTLTRVTVPFGGSTSAFSHTTDLVIADSASDDPVRTMWDSTTISATLLFEAIPILEGGVGGHKIRIGDGTMAGQLTTVRTLGPKSTGKWLIEACFQTGFADRVWFGLVLASDDITGLGPQIGRRPGSLGVSQRSAGAFEATVWYDGSRKAGFTPYTQSGFETPNAVITLACDFDIGEVRIYQGGVLRHTQTIATGVAYCAAFSGDGAAQMTLRTDATLFPVAGYSDWTI